VIAFLSPWFLAGALAAAVPLLLHLLKREPEVRLKFSAVRLLHRAPVEHTRRRHLNELLLLALRVAALLLLAFAFARPYFASGAAFGPAGVTVVALDTSMSLSAPGRFERARALATEAIEGAPSGDRVGVVTFADQAQVVAPLSTDRGLAAAAVAAAEPGYGATRYQVALNAAAEMFEDRPGEIVVVTDLQERGWEAGVPASLPASVRVRIVDVGPLPPNFDVAAVRREGDRIVATVRNTGPTPRQARVRVTIVPGPTAATGALAAGADTAIASAGDALASVGPNQSAEVVLPLVRGAAAAVHVEDPEGLAGDDTRYLLIEQAGRPSVAVVTANGDLAREAFYLHQALLAPGSGGAAFQVTGVGASQLSGWSDGRLDAQAAVVLLATRGLDRRGRELLAGFVRRGGGLLLAAGPDVDSDVAADALARTVTLAMPARSAPAARTRALAPADSRHPVFRAFSAGGATLGLARFPRVAAVSGATCQTLARFTTGEPALAECPGPGDGRTLVFASDLDNRWNDFPLHSAFVPFVHETVRYLSGSRIRSSEYLVGGVPSGVASRPGVAEIPGGADVPARWAVVNVDPDESDPGRVSAEAFHASITRLEDAVQSSGSVEVAEQEDRQHLWQYVLALMLVVLATESLVAARMA